MHVRWIGLGLLCAAVSCGKDPPPTATPEPAPVAQTQTETETPPPAETEDEVDEDLDDAEGDDDDAPADDDDTLTVEKAAQLVTDAVDAATDPYAARVITPPLPETWPVAGKLVYYVYPLATFEGAAVDAYDAKTPSHRAVLDVATAEVTLEELSKGKKLGKYTHTRVRHDDAVAKAEQALLDLAAGRVEQKKVHYLLVGYGKWFETHGKVGADCRKRVQAFADWADSWGH